MAKIVTIDDDQEVSNLMIKLFTRAGHKVSPTRSTIEGINTINRVNPDLVIVDISIPKEPQCNFIEELAKLHVPIILMSGGYRAFDEHYLKYAAESIGAMATLVKPFIHSEIKSIVTSVLREYEERIRSNIEEYFSRYMA